MRFDQIIINVSSWCLVWGVTFTFSSPLHELSGAVTRQQPIFSVLADEISHCWVLTHLCCHPALCIPSCDLIELSKEPCECGWADITTVWHHFIDDASEGTGGWRDPPRSPRRLEEFSGLQKGVIVRGISGHKEPLLTTPLRPPLSESPSSLAWGTVLASSPVSLLAPLPY